MDETRAMTAGAKLLEEPMETRKIPTAQVSRGPSQNAALRVLEGLQRVKDCQAKLKIPAHAVEARSGGNHSRGRKW